MSSSVFVDTSAWIALINKSDVFHLKAKTVRDILVKDARQCLVTDFVVVEIANSLSRIPWRSSAIQLINSIYASKNINVLEIDKDIYVEA
jgi:uncharacterized protein